MKSRILLVGVIKTGNERWAKIEALEELAALVRTSGGTVVEKIISVRPEPEPATLIGRGKAEEIRDICRSHGIELVVFEDELTPTQLRNLEDIISVRVVDRTAVILDIFALHARTAEAKVQVELAQLDYYKTRLTGLGVAMSQLGGGIGTRGPGETKLELDRRRIEQRITALRRKLNQVEQERMIQRKRRSDFIQFSIAGYTNAGKSTLFNRLTNSQAKVSSQLFATLDASTRLLVLKPFHRVLVTDTVGFIRNLPLQLVASFRSTLAEIREADLIIHVADASGEAVEQKIEVVNETLANIGAKDKPKLLVFNKIDRVFDDMVIERLRTYYPQAVFVSALTGEGINSLLGRLIRFVEKQMVIRTFTVPSDRWDLIARLLESGEILADEEHNKKRRFRIRGSSIDLARLRKQINAALR